MQLERPVPDDPADCRLCHLEFIRNEHIREAFKEVVHQPNSTIEDAMAWTRVRMAGIHASHRDQTEVWPLGRPSNCKICVGTALLEMDQRFSEEDQTLMALMEMGGSDPGDVIDVRMEKFHEGHATSTHLPTHRGAFN